MVRRPLVAALRSSPSFSAALFQEWPLGVIRPSRNSLAWASASEGASTAGSPTSTGAPRRWYEAARSLLALTSGHRRLDGGTVMVADTAPGALVVRGIRLALNGQEIPLQSGRSNVMRDMLLTRALLH